jgi:hypothetical protein
MPIVGTIASKVITNAAFFITLNRSPFISSQAGQWLADYEKVGLPVVINCGKVLIFRK